MLRRLRCASLRIAVAALAAAGLGCLPALASAVGSARAGTPAGTITRTIALPGAGQVEIVGGQVWVLTSTRLIRLNPRTGRVVGRPLRFPGEHGVQLAAAGGRLWAFGSSTLYRIDPHRGAFTGTIVVGRNRRVNINGVDVVGDTVWVLRGDARSARLLRYDARTLRRVGRALPAPRDSFLVEATPSQAFLTAVPFNSEPPVRTLTRLNLRTGARRTVVLTGGSAPAFASGGAWTASGGEGIARVDLGTLAYDPHVVRTTGRRPTNLAVGLGSLWATASRFVERRGSGLFPPPPLLRDHALYRVDPATGLLAGDPVPLPASPVGITTGLGSVWVTTGTGRLLRIQPTRPRPPLTPEPAPSTPLALLRGPLAAGTYLSQSPFGLPVTLTLADGGWLSTPASSSGSLDAEMLQLQRADSAAQAIVVFLPTGVFGTQGKVLTSSPADALAAWQANPELRVTNVGSTTIAGQPATVADLAPQSGVRRVRVIALTGGDFSTGDDGTGGPPIAVVLTQSPSGRLVIAMIFLGPSDARPPAQAVVQSLAFP